MKIDRDTTLLIGRVLLVTLFLVGGFLKIKNLPGTEAYRKEVGIPGAGQSLALAAGLAEFLGALAILVGYQTRKIAAALVAYLLPVTWYTHLALVWATTDPLVRDNEIFQTLKGVAIIGGLGLLYVTGPGGYSLDKK